MKITFFIGGLIGGGAERVTCSLSNYLVNNGHNVEILTMSESDSYPLDNRVSRSILLTKKERKGFINNLLVRFRRLKQYLEGHECDCYVVMLPITTILLLSLKKYAKAPIVASERCYPAVFSQIMQRLLLLILCRRASGWVFQTPQAREWYGARTGESKVTIIPNAINEAFLRPAFYGDRQKKIVAIGRMSVQKNYPLLLKAFSQLATDFPEYRLLILGEGELRKHLGSMVYQLNIGDRVDMPGYVTDIPDRLQSAALYVLPSDYEGMPNTLMEAMALGVPCIATDCDGGGAAFLIEDGVNGLLVPKGDVETLANAMRRMLFDRDFAETCGRNALKICDRLAPEKVYGQWEIFIKEVCNK